MSKATKPPLGVMPRKLWLEHRAQELSRAIHEHVMARRYDPLAEWLDELGPVFHELLQIEGDSFSPTNPDLTDRPE